MLPLVLLLFGNVAFCQKKDRLQIVKESYSLNNSNDSTSPKKVTNEKDLFDVISSVFKKNSALNSDTLTNNSKPVYSIVPAVGYTLQTKLAAVVSGNVAFFISPKAKMSTISASATYTQNKQFYVPVESNISSKNNLYKFIGDYRFYKYPQSTFGLGSKAPLHNEDPMDYTYFRFYETILRKIKGNFFAGMGYNLDYHWNISHKGMRNGNQSDFGRYDPSHSTVSSGITLNALYDSRNNLINAKKGVYANFQFRNNLQALGSKRNWESITVDLRKYFLFPGRSKNVLAFWSYNTLITFGKPPYLDLPSTGWDSYNSTGRGFIQGRYRGTKMVYLESEYRCRITSNGLLGAVFFANSEAFAGGPKSQLESFQTGYGTGVRIKLNKQSDTNLAIDYGFGTQGSKGLFIAVGEVF